MKKNNTSKAAMIKSAAYNKVQRYFQTSKKYNKETRQWEVLDPLAALSDTEKFKAIQEIMSEAVNEMKNYRVNRRNQRVVHAKRVVTGWYDKRAAKRARHKEYMKNKQSAA